MKQVKRHCARVQWRFANPTPGLTFSMTEPIRLSKRLQQLYECSRREADLLIEGGWVMVDGEVVEEPQFKVLEQIITLHPEARAEAVEPVTILLHKPIGCHAGEGENSALSLINTASHADDDPSRIRMLKKHFSRLQPLLPLETDACGLQVYTQDYRVSRSLVDDGWKIEQEFVVEVAGNIIPNGLALLNHGLEFDGRVLPPNKVSWQNETRLRFALKSPHSGQINHVCEAVGLTVLNLKRIRIGRISMARLPEGQWRYLPYGQRF